MDTDRSPRCILLVEDSPQDAELVQAALSKADVMTPIVHVRDGVEALDYLHRNGEFANRSGGLPAVVLLDLKMPRIDGVEVLRRVKGDSELKTLPVIIMTTSREERDVAQTYALGANAYVVKPVRFQELVETMKHLGMFWTITNEPPPQHIHVMAT